MWYTFVIITLLQLYSVTGVIQKRDETITGLNESLMKAESQLKNYFINKIWEEVSAVQVKSSHDLLKLYSESTLEQTQQVVEYIITYSNVTRHEADRLRAAAKVNNTKNYNQIDCVNVHERNLIRAFKQTGYNLHTCIRNAQLHSENITMVLLNDLETTKGNSLKSLKHYLNELTNCLDQACVFRVLMSGTQTYDEMEAVLKNRVIELQSATTRYLMSHIALGCVSNAMKQILENYTIGQDVMIKCLERNNVVIKN